MFEFLRSFFKQEKAMKEVSEIIVSKDESSDIPILNDIFDGIIYTLINDPKSWEDYSKNIYALSSDLVHDKSNLHIKCPYQCPKIRDFKMTIEQYIQIKEAISKRLTILEEIHLEEIRHNLGVGDEK